MAQFDQDHARRRALGAWYTPHELVDELVAATLDTGWLAGRRGPITVLDPACGDGRFLLAAGAWLDAMGVTAEFHGVDIDPQAVALARTSLPTATIVEADALTRPWAGVTFDVVLGNPPFLSPLVADSGVAPGRRETVGGPYADAAADFLLASVEAVTPDGGRVGLVLPQSLLAARDAAPVRARVDALATIRWSRTTDEHDFGASVSTCIVLAERPGSGDVDATRASWGQIAADGRGVPPMPALDADGVLGDRVRATVGFRDEFYSLAAAAGDDVDGPPLVTSGMIDPARCWWGAHPARVAKRSLAQPRVDLQALEPRMQRWVAERAVPKVLVANQTAVIEAVADPHGEFVPAVPVIAVLPDHAGERAPVLDVGVWDVAAVLTSPIAAQWAWQQHGGTGMSARVVRLSPTLIESMPWPVGSLAPAVGALRAGDVQACGAAVVDAFGAGGSTEGAAGLSWWSAACARVAQRAARRPTTTVADPH
ncbi:MAG: N-6 DNA methylase [Actinomycetota bacterium]